MRMKLAITALLLSATVDLALAQNSGGVTRGLFGPRTLGGTLQPRPRTMAEGIITTSSGQFVGRGRAQGLTFNPSIWQSSIGQQQQAEVWLRRSESERAVVPESPAGAAPPPAPPAPPEQWLRRPAAEAGAMRRAMPAYVAEPSAELAGAVAPAALARLIESTPRIAKRSPIRVTLEGETAVLRGSVQTAHDRALAEDIARMEPGVWIVRNELLVEPSAASAR